MFNYKKISVMLAVLLSISMIAGACSKDGDAENTDVSINVIDKVDDVTTTTAPIMPAPGETFTNADGTPVTGINGEVLTAPPETAPIPPADENATTTQGMSLEDLFGGNQEPPTILPDRPVESSERYGYNTLNDEEKELYDKIVEGATVGITAIPGYEDWSGDSWTKVMGMVYNQEPQLFWLSPKTKVGEILMTTSNPYQIDKMQDAILENVQPVLDAAEAASTTYDKLKIFHDYIVLNAVFEKGESRSDYHGTIYGVFANPEGTQGAIQCSGYAKTMHYLCGKAGIESMVIVGENEHDLSHAWNVVKVDGEWYNIDATFDDPIFDEPVLNYLRHTFFLVPDEWIHGETHRRVNEFKNLDGTTYTSYFDAPVCDSTDANYFHVTGTVYSDFASADAGIKSALDNAIDNGLGTAHIMVDSLELYNKLIEVRMDYNTHAKERSSTVRSLSDISREKMLIVQFDIKYN